jgi:hypothetical protein
MPHPVREDVNWGRGLPLMRTDQYSIEHIQLDHAQVNADDARFVVGDLVLRNATYAADELALASPKFRKI